MTEDNTRELGKYQSLDDHGEFSSYMDAWSEYSLEIKEAFLLLFNHLSEKPAVFFDFKLRLGVSASSRGYIEKQDDPNPQLLILMDIIDEDPEDKWLSVCFYAEMITDPEEQGDLIPGGLLGEDGYCFDMYEKDDKMIEYLEQRIDEAHERALAH